MNVIYPHMDLAKKYPYLDAWVFQVGYVEIGANEFSSSMVRALDQGGMAFEGESSYSGLDAALAHLNEGIKARCEENGIELDLESD